MVLLGRDSWVLPSQGSGAKRHSFDTEQVPATYMRDVHLAASWICRPEFCDMPGAAEGNDRRSMAEGAVVMACKDPSVIDDILCLSPPWSGSLSFYSVRQKFMGFTIDYKSLLLLCPLCGEECDVIDKKIITWKAPELLGFDTTMTAYLPVVGYHNFNCRVDQEKDLLGNTLLLDLILKQMSLIDYTNPFVQLFSASEVILSN